MASEATEEQVNYIIDSLQEFHRHSAEIGKMDFTEMRNFMEPRFEKAGYRQLPPLKGQNTKILLLHNTAIGDFLSMTPAIREIRRVYPDAYIVLVIGSAALSIAECCPHIDEIIIDEKKYDTTNFSAGYEWNVHMARKLLSYQFDIAFAFEFTKISMTPLLAYMCGAKERATSIWSDIHRLFLALMTAVAPAGLYGVHAVDNCLACLECIIRSPISNRKLEAWITPKDRTDAREFLKEKVSWNAICMGGNLPSRHWPPESYGKLIHLLMEKEDSHFVLLGGEGDLSSGQEIRNIVNSPRVIDLIGKLTFRQTIAVLQLCEFCISNDTSIVHAASAMGIPSLVPNCFPNELHFDGISTVDRWHPYGVPSVVVKPEHALPECKNSTDMAGCWAPYPHCIAQIKPKHMLEAFQILKDRTAKGITEPYFFIARN